MEKALVVVDMQAEFIRQCGAADLVLKTANKIRARAKEGYEIIFTIDREGGGLAAELKAVCPQHRVYHKHSYGCSRLVLDLYAEKPRVVEFCGVCTDVCVITNVLATMAFLPFAEIVVDGDCCASADGGHVAALSVMKACNVKVV